MRLKVDGQLVPIIVTVAVGVSAMLGLAWIVVRSSSAVPSVQSPCWHVIPVDVKENGTGGSAATESIKLNDIAALSTGEPWAVGARGDDGSPQALVLRRRESGWESVQYPSDGGAYTSSTLQAVAALSPDDIWAVGTRAKTQTAHSETLIVHWDGTKWGTVPAPSPGADGNSLSAISAVSADDIWAAGFTIPAISSQQPLLLHWDGKSWTEKPAGILEGASVINGVAAIARDDVWAVGSSGGSITRALALHWDGVRWQVVASPTSDMAVLEAVSAAGPNDVWAVGYMPSAGGFSPTLTMHWNGQRWQQVPSPSSGSSATPIKGGGQLTGVAAIKLDDAWAVGDWGGGFVDDSWRELLVLHWDGTRWNVDLEALSFRLSSVTLGGVTASTGGIWSVGSYVIKKQAFNQPLSLRRATGCAP